VQQAEEHAGEKRHRDAGPEAGAGVDRHPAGEGADHHDALDAEVEHPARSQISSPMVAKISGEAMRIAAAQKLAESRRSRISIAP
jgi:hypothetical protein